MRDTIHFVLFPATLTGVVTAICTYILIRVSALLGLNAQPRSNRWHIRTTPNTGGIAIFGGCAVAYIFLAPLRHVPMAFGALGIWLLGVIDDRIPLRPLPKLISQAFIVLATVVASGTRPLTPWFLVNLGIEAVWILGVTNAFNLIDNMDGLCAGVTVIIAAAQCLVLGLNGSFPDARIFAIIAGAFCGFLVFNYNPAQIFMGDSGSMLAGFSLSAMTLVSPLAHTRLVAGGAFYTIMLFAYPLFDTALVSVLRRLCGRPISEGGRDHSSHRLVSSGLDERHATYFLWGLTLSGAMVGLLVSPMPLYAIAAAVVLVVLATVLAIFLATLPDYPLDLIPGILRLSKWLPHINAGLTLLVDCCGIGLALFLAEISRYDGQPPSARFQQLSVAIPVTMLCYLAVAFTGRNIWRVSWTYFGLADSVLLLRTLFLAAALSFVVLTRFLHLAIPRGVVIVFGVLAVGLIVGMRSSLRVFRELLRPKVANIRQIAIFGTGDLAAMVLTLLRMTRFANGVPVMFLSDNEHCADMIIAGVRVYSIRDGLERLQAQYRCSAILYPEGSGTLQTRDLVRQMCKTAQLEFLSVDLRVRPEELQSGVQPTI